MTRNGTFLIVLYNKEIKNSETYQSLINYPNSLSSIDLVIWNNGPSEIIKEIDSHESSKFSSITIKEEISNCSLSKIYNEVLELHNNEFTVILDDDSTLSNVYIESMLKSNKEYCYVPVLTSNGDIESPKIKRKKIDSSPLPPNTKKFRGVGSGLIIGSDFAEDLKSVYGSVFDERFFLYGVDTTFFVRLERAKLLSKIKIIPGFEHAFSRLSTEPDDLKTFRSKERAYDNGLRARHYKSKASLIIYIIRVSIKTLNDKLRGKQSSNHHILKAIISGKHYRDDK